MKALVTGAAGFVGRHMVAELMSRGWSVAGTDPAFDGACGGSYRRIPDGMQPWGVDAFKTFQIAEDMGWRYDLVVHAAAQSPHRAAIDGQPASHIRNQMLDAAMFDWAVRTRQSRLLYLSSCAAFDETPDDYGLLKLTGERMAQQARAAGLPVTVVRPFSGYGEDQGTDWPFGAFVERARRRDDPFIIWGDGSQVRDWIHIDDVVNGALAVVESGTDEPVSLCTGVETSMLELAGLMCETAGYQPEFEFRLDKPAGQPYRLGDPSKLLRYYTPQVTIAEGVKRALA